MLKELSQLEMQVEAHSPHEFHLRQGQGVMIGPTKCLQVASQLTKHLYE